MRTGSGALPHERRRGDDVGGLGGLGVLEDVRDAELVATRGTFASHSRRRLCSAFCAFAECPTTKSSSLYLSDVAIVPPED